jgi:DNA-binding transcriptional regulator WhiA
MQDRGCTPEILKELYFNQRMSITQIMKKFNVLDRKVLDRWLTESGIIKREDKSTYTFNKYYFDEINTEEKAYWLGFIFCDGYICKRKRKYGTTYEFKLAISEQDIEHLEKLNSSLESNYPIKIYGKYGNGFDSEFDEARLYISNKYFASNLYENYGIVPDRFSIDKIKDKLDDKLVRHFIRGVFDADGSVSEYYVKVGNNMSYKNVLQFSSYGELLEFIQDYFYNNDLIKQKSKFSKRHEDRDGHCVRLIYSGTVQVPRILNHLYTDSRIHLDRKHAIFKEILIKTNKEKM